jgi:hypothetical protein
MKRGQYKPLKAGAGEEAATSAPSVISTVVSVATALAIVGLAVGVIITGVYLGNTRGDVSKLQAQTSNVTVFTPQTISFEATPARFVDPSPGTLHSAFVLTQGFCVTLTNFSTCSLTIGFNASYTDTPPSPYFIFNVTEVFPVDFLFPVADPSQPFQTTAVIIDTLTNATTPTGCSLETVLGGANIHIECFIMGGAPSNTVDNNVVLIAGQLVFNYLL